MKIPESPPLAPITMEAIEAVQRRDLEPLFDKAISEALYWDKVKYLPLPHDVTPENFWVALTKLKLAKTSLWVGPLRLGIGIGPSHHKLLHEFDLHFGGTLISNERIGPGEKEQFLISSIMEEAIRSSQIEGAVTTRNVAKAMLAQNKKPVTHSELMIYNNFITIRRLKELVEEPFSEKLILEIQALITQGTMENPEGIGHFRTSNDVRVINHVDGTVVHQPPSFEEIPELMEGLYDFVNREKDPQFVHPILKASILHFLIGYIHPFSDGNGRTARAIFYWYLLKKGYWLTEFLSISSIILKSKDAYAKAFLYTEADSLEMRYFLNYKLKVIRLAYSGLREYIKRKIDEKAHQQSYLKIGGINQRQASILNMVNEEPGRVLTVKEIETKFGIVNQSARSDLKGLEALGLLKVILVNKQKQVFHRVDDFEKVLAKLSKTS